MHLAVIIILHLLCWNFISLMVLSIYQIATKENFSYTKNLNKSAMIFFFSSFIKISTLALTNHNKFLLVHWENVLSTNVNKQIPSIAWNCKFFRISLYNNSFIVQMWFSRISFLYFIYFLNKQVILALELSLVPLTKLFIFISHSKAHMHVFPCSMY